MPWPTGPQSLLIRATVAPDEQVVAAFRAWRALVDEDHVDGGSFRLLPFLFYRLRKQGYDDPAMRRLKAIYHRAWSQSRMLFHQVAPAVEALEAAGIRTMLIKGASMALTYYPAIAARPLGDVDLVVKKDDAQEALRVLHDLGWRRGTRVPLHELPDKHAVDLHLPTGHEIDLHWYCLREIQATAADDWFWNAAVPLNFQGVRTWQPSATAQLLHTILHGMRSNWEPPLRWIPDAMMIMQTGGSALDWHALTAFAKQQKLSHRLHLGLAYLADTHAAPVPRCVLDALGANGVSLIERVENIVYFGQPGQMGRPMFPLLDYWRFLRNQSIGPFLRGYGAYLQRRWQLDSPLKIPLFALATLGRKMVRSRPLR